MLIRDNPRLCGATPLVREGGMRSAKTNRTGIKYFKYRASWSFAAPLAGQLFHVKQLQLVLLLRFTGVTGLRYTLRVTNPDSPGILCCDIEEDVVWFSQPP